MSHTPGPWKVGHDVSGINYNANIVYAPTGDPLTANAVAQVYGIAMHRGLHELPPGSEAGLANARLIAAAPELLDVARDARSVLRMADRSDAWRAERDRVVTKLEAAIAKAEGK